MRVYPRLRGDHARPTMQPSSCAGLPPPARGSLQPYACAPGGRRSTPACAGITLHLRNAGVEKWVYPRLRGDHPSCSMSTHAQWGLPPPARGSLLLPRLQPRHPRSTPACAGITPPPPACAAAPWVYPRLRGDHGVGWGAALGLLGLPPPARGSLARVGQSRERTGSTPACAGITSAGSPRPGPARVYPRLRGDHHLEHARLPREPGLPPPARGSRPPARDRTPALRSTPACAGITPRGPWRRRGRKVYPRLRGDHGEPESRPTR